MKGREFTTLDAMRGIAALAVVTRHSPAFFGAISYTAGYPCGDDPSLSCPILLGPLFKAELAVDFFFALGGFVIAYAYEYRITHGMSPIKFMRARLTRLYPLYLLGTVAGGLLAFRSAFYGGIEFSDFVGTCLFSILFLPTPQPYAIGHVFLYPLNPPVWSLFFQLLANAVYGLAAPYLTTRRLIILVVAAAVVLSTVKILWGDRILGGEWFSFGGGTVRVMFSFFAGVLVYRLWSTTKYRPQVPNVLFPVLLLAIFAPAPPSFLLTTYDLLATIFVFPLMIYCAAGNNPSNTRLQSIYTSLGLASYAIYVIHWPIYDLIERARRYAGHQEAILNPIWGLVLLAVLVLISLAIDRYYDAPVRKLLKVHLMPRTPAKAIANQKSKDEVTT